MSAQQVGIARSAAPVYLAERRAVKRRLLLGVVLIGRQHVSRHHHRRWPHQCYRYSVTARRSVMLAKAQAAGARQTIWVGRIPRTVEQKCRRLAHRTPHHVVTTQQVYRLSTPLLGMLLYLATIWLVGFGYQRTCRHHRNSQCRLSPLPL